MSMTLDDWSIKLKFDSKSAENKLEALERRFQAIANVASKFSTAVSEKVVGGKSSGKTDAEKQADKEARAAEKKARNDEKEAKRAEKERKKSAIDNNIEAREVEKELKKLSNEKDKEFKKQGRREAQAHSQNIAYDKKMLEEHTKMLNQAYAKNADMDAKKKADFQKDHLDALKQNAAFDAKKKQEMEKAHIEALKINAQMEAQKKVDMVKAHEAALKQNVLFDTKKKREMKRAHIAAILEDKRMADAKVKAEVKADAAELKRADKKARDKEKINASFGVERVKFRTSAGRRADWGFGAGTWNRAADLERMSSRSKSPKAVKMSKYYRDKTEQIENLMRKLDAITTTNDPEYERVMWALTKLRKGIDNQAGKMRDANAKHTLVKGGNAGGLNVKKIGSPINTTQRIQYISASEKRRFSSAIDEADLRLMAQGEIANRSSNVNTRGQQALIRSLQGELKKLQAEFDTIGTKNSGKYDELLDRLKDVRYQIKSVGMAIRDSERHFTVTGFTIDKFTQSLKNLVRSWVSVFAIIGSGKQLVNTAMDLERIRASLLAVSGSPEGATKDFEYLAGLSKELGTVDLTSAVRGYQQLGTALTAAGYSTSVTKKVFEAAAKASTAFSLSADDTAGVMRAFSQMASKGRVSMEELGQQLGDRLPGAAQIAAKSMGMTTERLFKMMAEGKIMSEEFLPKFADALTKSVEKNGALAAGMDTTAAAMGRLRTSYQLMVAQLTDAGLLDIVKRFLGLASFLINVLTPPFKALVSILNVLTGAISAILYPITALSEAIGGEDGLSGVAKLLGVALEGLVYIWMTKLVPSLSMTALFATAKLYFQWIAAGALQAAGAVGMLNFAFKTLFRTLLIGFAIEGVSWLLGKAFDSTLYSSAGANSTNYTTNNVNLVTNVTSTNASADEIGDASSSALRNALMTSVSYR